MKVAGLDLSLTGTGVATIEAVVKADGSRDYVISTTTISTKGKTGYERLRHIRDRALDLVEGSRLVVVEGPSFGSQGSAYHQLAGLWWMVTDAVDGAYGTGKLVIAPPSTIKKFATGKGNTPKDGMMLATARKFPNFEGDNNAADALWAASMAMARLGHIFVQGHQDALEKVEWP